MNGWLLLLLVIAALIVFAVVLNLRELIRYLKIRNM